jgi:uncharacterized protein YybS (DUF2232 family)
VTWVTANLILVHLETVLVSVQDRCTILRQMHHRLSNRFGRTQWYFEETRLKWKLILVRLERVLILMQDRCIVYAEHTIG